MKKRILSTVLVLVTVLSLISVLAVGTAAADTSIDSAPTLTLGSTYTQNWTSATDEDVHYGKFTISSPGVVCFTATKPLGSGGNYLGLYFTVFNKNKQAIWAGGCTDREKATETVVVGLAAGTYYLAVESQFYVISGTFTTKYKIAHYGNSYAEREPNGGTDTATPLTVGRAYTGYLGDAYTDGDESDVYIFNAKAGTVYRIVFDNFDDIDKTTTIIKLYHNGKQDSNVTYSAKNKVSGGKHYYDFVAAASAPVQIQFYNYGGSQYKYIFTVTTPSCKESGIHTYGAWKTTTAPTCATEGVATRTCTTCGAKETKSVPGDYDNHKFDAGVVWTEPGCTTTGTRKRTCVWCGRTKYEDIAPTGHLYSVVSFVTTPVQHGHGVANFRCDKCGYTYTGEFCLSLQYNDRVANTHWAHEAIDYAVWRGLLTGTSDHTFEPNTTMTRAMLVSVLWRLSGSEKVNVWLPFTDLKASWYKDAVAWAYQYGVVSGTSTSTFDPDAPVTREQLASILMRYAQYRRINTQDRASLYAFPDCANVSKWAWDSTAWAVSAGIISGKSAGGQTLLDPQGKASRAEVASIMMRFCKNFGL